MNCRRIITSLTFYKGALYRTKKFMPDYVYTTNFVDLCWADEIVVLNISTQSEKEIELFTSRVEAVAKNCFVPLAAGGGIKNIDDVDRLFAVGVDKIVINTAALENPTLIGECAAKYGSQAVVVSIDAKKESEDGRYRVYKNCGKVETSWDPSDWAKQAVEYGAGEIMINSIDKDGSLTGYDIELCRAVSEAVIVPVLICGGAGNWKHFEEGFVKGNANAVCTTNIYHFSESSMKSAKKYLSQKGMLVRN